MTTAAEIIGGVLIAVAMGLIWFPLGILAAGVLLMVFGYAGGNES